MTELFPTDETLSPRLEWMRRYDVKVHRSPHAPTDEPEPWCAYWGDVTKAMTGNHKVALGETEDEAITALAKLMGWKLWNEEGLGK